MQKLLKASLVAALCLACTKKQETAVSTTSVQSTTTVTTVSSTTTAAATATAPAAPADAGEDLLALSAGALVVQNDKAGESGEAWQMFDEDPTTGWSNESAPFSEQIVVELADRSQIRSIAFDLASDEWDGRIPKEVLLEMSDTSAKEGYQPILAVTVPQEQKDGVTFPTTAQVPGRWLRFTVKSLYTGQRAQVMELRAFGDRLTHDAPPSITGSYKTADKEDFLYLTQNGTQVTGCYSHGLSPLVGGMEGRLLKYSYALPDNDSGPAIAIFSKDGKVFGGRWKTTGVSAEHPRMQPTEMTRTSDTPGKCPNEKKPEDTMANEIRKKGRLRLYGINFDSDSAALRDESKPTLDLVASMLNTNSDLTITIEGHTDATSTPEHNQTLSEERANAVKAYLAGAGVDVARLTAAGFGSTKPLTTNDTPLGRAANRRVELVKG